MPRGTTPNPPQVRLDKTLPSPPASQNPSPPLEGLKFDHDYAFPDNKRKTGPSFLSRASSEARSIYQEAAILFDGVPVARIALVALAALIFVVPGVLLTVPSSESGRAATQVTEAPRPATFWAAFTLVGNPFDSLRAEEWETEWTTTGSYPDGDMTAGDMDGKSRALVEAWKGKRPKFTLESRTWVPGNVAPIIHPSDASRPSLRMVFGAVGSGKTTIRLLLQRAVESKSWTKSSTAWFAVGAAEISSHLSHFQSHLWRNAGTVARLAYAQDAYLRARFPIEFGVGDLVDILVTKAVGDILSGSVAIRTSRLQKGNAACLARLATTYYIGSNETLASFLSSLRVQPAVAESSATPREVRVLPLTNSELYECPLIDGGEETGPLTALVRVLKESGVGEVNFAIDDLRDIPLFAGDAGTKAVRALAKVTADPALGEILGGEKASLWAFLPGSAEATLEKEAKERLSALGHEVLDRESSMVVQANALVLRPPSFNTYY
ncbi:hypothetical protein HDU93_005204 [Gonapodya sp. JEL0774]|nr:hypothetical protein HDU93_005204 [Gonapodya sp. JEL0774]